MPDKTEQQRRKAVVQAIAEQQRAQALARMPLAAEQLAQLFDHLDTTLAAGCDHSLRFTLQFLQQHGLQAANIVPWLQSHGGYCDCEVLANVEDAWQ